MHGNTGCCNAQHQNVLVSAGTRRAYINSTAERPSKLFQPVAQGHPLRRGVFDDRSQQWDNGASITCLISLGTGKRRSTARAQLKAWIPSNNAGLASTT